LRQAPATALAATFLVALLCTVPPTLAGPSPTAIVPLVEPDAPANYSMDTEPSYTNGTSNTVSWQPGDDPSGSTPLEYYVQVSRQLGFGTIEANSGWISPNSTTFTGLQDGILFYYRVRARDSLGNVGGYSAPTASTQDDSAPPTPIIGSEPAYTVSTFNSVAWGATTDAGVGGVQYFAEASTASTFSSIFSTSGWVAGTSVFFFSLTSGTTYFYHVKARDAFGQESAWSSVVSSTQDADAPTVPVIDPEPAFTVGTSNAISWAASSDSGVGGVQYQLQYSASSTFASGVVSSAWQAATSFTASPLAAGTQYYFRVSARDAFAQQSANSAIVSSTQDNAAPSTPAITAEPAFTNGTSNTIVWSTSVDAGAGGVGYLIEQSRSATFTTLEDSSGWISATSHTFTKLDDGVAYFYRVQARDALGLTTPFSGTVSSTQDNSPPTAPVLAPEPAYTAGLLNTIVWGASVDAGVGGVQYMAELSTSSTFATISQTSGWTASTFATFLSLTDGTSYYYRVRARDAFGRETLQSSVTSSTQDNSAPPVPGLGAEPSFTQGTSNLVAWSAVVDAGSGGEVYEVQSATNAAFTVGLVSSGFQSATSFTFTSLTNGQSYFYRVRARDALGLTSAFSASASTTMDNAPPGLPALSAEPAFTAGTTNAVSWGAVVDAGSGGVQYWVESARVATFAVVDSASGWISATSFTFTRLDDGVRYFYRVKARDALAQESAFSATVSSVQDSTAPPVPTMTPLAAISSSTFQVPTWGAVTDAGSGGVQYFAEYASAPSFASPLGNSGWTTNTFWIVFGLVDGTTYYYHVKSRDSLLQESAYSAAIFSRQDNAPPTAPVMSAEPSFTAGTSNTVSWSTSTDAGIGGVVYDLQYATNAAFTGATTVAGLSTTTNTISGLTGGSTYFFRVRARDAFAIATAFSAGVSSTQDNASPPTPAMTGEPGFTAGTSNAVSWSTVVDAGVGGVQYDVQASRTPFFTVIESESGWIAATTFTFTRLEDGVLYYFRVAARDGFQFQSGFSGSASSTQDNSAPSVPVLSPEPQFTAGTANSLSWGASVDAGVGGITYQLQYSDTPAFTGAGTVLVNGASSPQNVAGLSNGVTFYYRARAADSFSFTSAWSNVEYSTQDSAGPAAPSMTAEPSFTVGSSNSISWSTSSDSGVGGVQYWAEFASSASFSTVLGNTGWASQTSATFFGLSDGTRYYFRAKARDAFAQESVFSASVNSQQDASPPSAPGTSALPSYTQGSSVNFGWSASSDAGVGGIEYEAQLAAGASFSPVLDSSGWFSGTSFAFAALDDGQSYFFRVRARDALGNVGAFSTVRSTTMDASPPTVPNLFSEPEFTAGTSNSISWGGSADAGIGGVQYQVQYALTPAFTPIVTVTTGWGVTSPYTAASLLDGTAYFYRVRARDAFQITSAWSAPERSTQDASPPLAPVSKGLPPFIDGSSTAFAWFATTDAGVGGIQYEAQVARDPFFSTVLQTSPWSSETTFVFAGLADGSVNYYRVRARDAFLFVSGWSAADAAMNDFLAPPVPQLSAMPAFSKGLAALASWTLVVDAGVGGVTYEVLAFATTDTTKPFSSTPWTSDTQQLVGGLPEGTLVYFAVHARDGLGHISALSAVVSTRADNSPPPSPTLRALPPFTSGLTLTAAWGAVTDAGVGGVLYRAQVSSDPSFASGLFDSGWVASMSFTPPTLVDGGLYFARVKAQDAFQFESSWSALERTELDNAPPGSSALSPLGAFTRGGVVSLLWSSVADLGVGGVEYNAQVSTALDFSVLYDESEWIHGTSWTFVGLADGTRYFFRVLARDAFLHNASPSASVSTTMDAAPPATPELLVMPAFTSGLQQRVGWNTVADLGVGGVEYLVESSSDGTFLGGAVSSGWVTVSEYTFAGLGDGERYFFRVHARDAFGHVSGWSQVRNATMDDSAPTLTLDASSIVTNMESTELTGTAADAVSGVLEVVYSSDGGATWLTAAGTTTWSASVSGLIEGETSVLVRARDGVGRESPIGRVLVTVDETAPIVAFQSPSNGSTVTGLLGVYAVIADPNFASFRLQERMVGRANFTDLVQNGTVARGDNFLGLWDTRTLENGLYELRVTARDALDQVTQRSITVRLLNSDLAVSYSDLSVSDRSPLRGAIINVTAVVTNYGTAAALNVTVRVKDNGAQVFERGGISIGPHGAYSVDIPYNVSSAGAHAFTLEVSYPEGALDTGLSTSTSLVASEPPVPEPKPFLVEFAGFFSLMSLVALAGIAAWAFVQIGRLKRGEGVSASYAGAVAEEAVDVEWESDEFL